MKIHTKLLYPGNILNMGQVAKLGRNQIRDGQKIRVRATIREKQARGTLISTQS